jgi:hypothetical protein
MLLYHNSEKKIKFFQKNKKIYEKSKKKITDPIGSVILSDVWNYCASGAPTGQVPAQAPQSTHSSALITYLPSTSEIALTGQPSAQAPQPRHVSALIT